MELLDDFSKDRKQKVVLNGKVSNWADVAAGVPQRSILGLFSFLIDINDPATDISSNAKPFVDGTLHMIYICKLSGNNYEIF